jgi:spore coat polysaccharide biosynthesis predicted glycosyltransferase SpsG/RimJ/RimL family protein N-acetyltransferase
VAVHAIAVDGYHLDPVEVRREHPSTPLLQIDDHGLSSGHGAATLVLDQNSGASTADYADVGATTRLLLGSRYVLLRASTQAAIGRARPVSAPHVVAFLGGDPSPKLVELVGAAAEQLRARGCSVEFATGAEDVPSAFGSAAAAIVTAGSTTWDLAALGVPMIVIPIAENQEPVAAALAEHGVADVVDASRGVSELVATVSGLLMDAPRRETMSARGMALIDGGGAVRVATSLRSDLVTLRGVVAGDAAMLWEWVNDRATRASAFDPSPIAWTDHTEWLDIRLRDVGTCMVVGSAPGGDVVGQLRVELEGTTGIVDVSVSPSHRGQGWAAPLVAAGSRWAARKLASAGLQRLEARVKPENVRSARAFEAADFDRSADGSDGTVTWWTYTWSPR